MFNEKYWKEKRTRELVRALPSQAVREWRSFAFLKGLFWREADETIGRVVNHRRSQKARRVRRYKHHQKMVSIKNA
jgi:hypothetical protein